MKTIQMTIDAHLLKAVDKLTRLRKTTRSALIRTALEAELRREQVRDLEARHASGYARRPAARGEFDAWIDQRSVMDDATQRRRMRNGSREVPPAEK